MSNSSFVYEIPNWPRPKFCYEKRIMNVYVFCVEAASGILTVNAHGVDYWRG